MPKASDIISSNLPPGPTGPTGPAGASPGGATGAVQYNNGSTFAGDTTNFYYTAASQSLTLTGTEIGRAHV